MGIYFTKSLTLAAVLKMIGFPFQVAVKESDGMWVFKYHVTEESEKEIRKWGDMYYANNLFVPPDRFLVTYKTIKQAIYEEANS